MRLIRMQMVVVCTNAGSIYHNSISFLGQLPGLMIRFPSASASSFQSFLHDERALESHKIISISLLPMPKLIYDWKIIDVCMKQVALLIFAL